MLLVDGTVNSGQSKAKNYTDEIFEEGDIITIKIHKGKLSFMRNDIDLGVAFESKDLEPSISNMYAFINLCMQGDTVEIVQLHS